MQHRTLKVLGTQGQCRAGFQNRGYWVSPVESAPEIRGGDPSLWTDILTALGSSDVRVSVFLLTNKRDLPDYLQTCPRESEERHICLDPDLARNRQSAAWPGT